MMKPGSYAFNYLRPQKQITGTNLINWKEERGKIRLKKLKREQDEQVIVAELLKKMDSFLSQSIDEKNTKQGNPEELKNMLKDMPQTRKPYEQVVIDFSKLNKKSPYYDFIHNINYYHYENPKALPQDILRLLPPSMQAKYKLTNPLRKAIILKNRTPISHRPSCSDCKVENLQVRGHEAENKVQFNEVIKGRVELMDLAVKNTTKTKKKNDGSPLSSEKIAEKIKKYKYKTSVEDVRAQSQQSQRTLSKFVDMVENKIKNAPTSIDFKYTQPISIDIEEEYQYDPKKFIEEYKRNHPHKPEIRFATPRASTINHYNKKVIPSKECTRCKTTARRQRNTTPAAKEIREVDMHSLKGVLNKFNTFNQAVLAHSRAVKDTIDLRDREDKIKEIRQNELASPGRLIDDDYYRQAQEEVFKGVNFSKIYIANNRYSYSKPIQTKPKTTDCWLVGSPQEQMKRKDIIFEMQSMDNVRKKMLS